MASLNWRVKIAMAKHLKLPWQKHIFVAMAKNVFWFDVKTHHKKLLNLPWQHILKLAMPIYLKSCHGKSYSCKNCHGKNTS